MAANHIPLDTGRAAGRDLKQLRDDLASVVARLEGQRASLTAMKDGESYQGLVENGVGQNEEQAANAYYQLDVLVMAMRATPFHEQLGQFLAYLGGN